MVSRTWSARLNTTIGSSAESVRCAVGIGWQNSISHLLGSGTSAERPEPRERRGDREVRQS